MKSTLATRATSGALALAFLATAIPALAHNTSTSTASTTNSTYNVVCVQTAVGVHEDAGISALNTYNTAVASALAVRKSGVIAAWGNLNFFSRLTALRAAYGTYRISVKTAKTNFKNSRISANTAFKASMNACGATSADVAGRSKGEKKESKKMKMDDFNWLGFHFGLDF